MPFYTIAIFRSNTQQDDDEDEEMEFKLVIPPAPKLEDEILELPYEEPPMWVADQDVFMINYHRNFDSIKVILLWGKDSSE